MKRTRLPKLTIRARLTLVYGGLFLLAGVLLLGATYLLVAYQLRGNEIRFDTEIRSDTMSQPQTPNTGQPMAPLPADSDTNPALTMNQTFASQLTDDALHTLLTQGGIALAVVCVAAGTIGWLLAGRLLQPLHKVTETARRIAHAPAADRSLQERIALDGPHDEVKDLADTFDLMLQRLDHSFDAQRRFIANASHELRTPLTLSRALLEVAAHRWAASPEVRQLSDTLLEISTRHERLIDGLLLLARSEGEILEHFFVDLADIVDHVAAQVPHHTVTLHTELAEAPTTGNPILLERLVQNLIENAIRHNIPEDGWVEVTTDTRPDGSAALTVSNTGPVIPPYEIPHLFEPFHRLGTDRLASTTPGAGLGLSIVQAITRAHSGTVQAEPRNSGGLLVTVTLPAATTPSTDSTLAYPIPAAPTTTAADRDPNATKSKSNAPLKPNGSVI